MENHGVAPIYRYIPVKIKLSNENAAFEFQTDIDMRNWLPGKITENVCITLPENMPAGEYDIEIGMYNDLNPVLYLCTDAVRNGSFYKIGRINID